MTLILKLILDMVKMYQHTKTEVSMSRHSKVIAQIDRQTARHTHTHVMGQLELNPKKVGLLLRALITEIKDGGKPGETGARAGVT